MLPILFILSLAEESIILFQCYLWRVYRLQTARTGQPLLGSSVEYPNLITYCMICLIYLIDSVAEWNAFKILAVQSLGMCQPTCRRFVSLPQALLPIDRSAQQPWVTIYSLLNTSPHCNIGSCKKLGHLLGKVFLWIRVFFWHGTVQVPCLSLKLESTSLCRNWAEAESISELIPYMCACKCTVRACVWVCVCVRVCVYIYIPLLRRARSKLTHCSLIHYYMLKKESYY